MNRLFSGVRDAPLGPGVYLDAAHDGDGQPIDVFLYDPPIILTPAGMNRMGIKPLRRDRPGVGESRMSPLSGQGVVEWLPQNRYLNVADFVEEARRVGVHRPCGLSDAELRDLTPASKLLFAHGKGYLLNWKQYGALRADCPKATVGHRRGHVPGKMCCGYWWQDLEGGHPDADRVERPTHFGTYHGSAAPGGLEPEYAPAMVARVPIGGITVVGFDGGDRRSDQQKALMEAVWAAGLVVRTIE